MELVNLILCLITILDLGMGKSRVIAAAILLKHLYDNTRSFTIVFTTELLKSVDEIVYT